MKRVENPMPHNIEAETALLGCILDHTPRFSSVVDRLQVSDFYRDAHGLIYAAIERVYATGKPFNVSSVVYDLKKQGDLDDAGGEYVVRDLASPFFSVSGLDAYVQEVKRTSTLRRAIQAAQTVFDASFAQQEDVVEQAVKLFTDIALGVDADSVSTLADIGHEYLSLLGMRRENYLNHSANGVPTGFRDLDHMLGGLQPADMIVLAARPALGKTSLALNIALNVVSQARHALVFSLEMSKMQLYQRLISMETPMNQTLLRNGDITDEEWTAIEAMHERLSTLDMKIDDRSHKLADIRNKARRIHAQRPLDVIVVDYLQLIEPMDTRAKNVNRSEEIALICKGLKRLAIDLNVPVLVLAQLNRDMDKRATRIPQLSDLAEGSAIEKDADIVACLYVTQEQEELKQKSVPYHVVVNVNKHRNGPVGEVVLTFKPRTTKFEDLTEGVEHGASA